jgi:hypothetical protein
MTNEKRVSHCSFRSHNKNRIKIKTGGQSLNDKEVLPEITLGTPIMNR